MRAPLARRVLYVKARRYDDALRWLELGYERGDSQLVWLKSGRGLHALPDEARFHLCDEPYAYAPEPGSACLSGGDRPSLRTLGDGRPAAGRAALTAEYGLPAAGPALLEVYDARGERVAVLARGRLARGLHTTTWRPERLAPGAYWWRLRADGVDLVRPAALGA